MIRQSLSLLTVLFLLSIHKSSCACPHLRAQASKHSTVSTTIEQAANGAFAYPICAKTNGKPVDYSVANICLAYDGIRADFKNLASDLSTPFQKADIYGGALRMAFHDAVDVDLSKPLSDVGASDGCIGDAIGSAGLVEGYPNNPNPPRQSVISKYLEPIYQKYCDNLNRADFFVLFAKFSVEAAEPTKNIVIPFQYGRRESQNCSGPNNAYVGRNPSGQDGVNELVQTFITQMGLDNVDIVTLLGAHTLGHVHKEFSGYDGHPNDPKVNTDVTVNAWDSTPDVFDNDYFVKVRLRPWAIVYGNPLGYVTAYATSNDKSKIPAVNSIWIDGACGTTAIGAGHVYPSAQTINDCSGNKRGPGTKLIALNADMALRFPINVTNYFNPGGNFLGQTLAHCELEERNDVRDSPVRCFGPAMKPVDASSSPFPPVAAVPQFNSSDSVNVFFDDYVFRECASQKSCCPNNMPCDTMASTPIKAWNDSTGQIQYTKKNFLPTFNAFSAGSIRDNTQVGARAHKAFIQQFQQSFKKMVTAGYSVDYETQKNQYSAAVNSKLGNLVSFDRKTSSCVRSTATVNPSYSPTTTSKSSAIPTASPPRIKPSNSPKSKPSIKPSVNPTAKPSITPSAKRTSAKPTSSSPSKTPSANPTTESPLSSAIPSADPTLAPISNLPTAAPTKSRSTRPSTTRSKRPSSNPTASK